MIEKIFYQIIDGDVLSLYEVSSIDKDMLAELREDLIKRFSVIEHRHVVSREYPELTGHIQNFSARPISTAKNRATVYDIQYDYHRFPKVVTFIDEILRGEYRQLSDLMCMTTRTDPLIQRDIDQGLEDIQAALRCKDIDLEYVENKLTSIKRSLAAAKNASDVFYDMIHSCFTSTLVQSIPLSGSDFKM